MDKVFASWEKRNLGRDAWEVTLSQEDAQDVKATVDRLHDPEFDGCYVVVKMPVGQIQLLHALEDDGFRFLETQFRLKDVLQPDALLAGLDSLGIRFEVKNLPNKYDAWRSIADQIVPGMFDTDRIALDPLFGPEVACRRYQNWLMDLCENPNAVLSVYEADGEVFAFNVQMCDPDKKSSHGLLGGVFPKFKGSGCGVFFVYDGDNCKCYGRRTTSVSSNNLSVLKLHQRCGRIIVGEEYVLRKLVNKRKS